MTSVLPLFRKLILVFSAVYLSLLVHELGHVLAGTLAGFRIVACGIGTAQPFAQIRIAGVRFYLARPLLPGMTWALPRRLGPDRKALAILSAGGPLANLAAGLVAWVVTRQLVDGTFVRLFVLCSLGMGIGNLVPFYSSIYGFPTDGLTIVRCIRNTLFYDPAHTITSYERFFARCKSLDAREGMALCGRALALECASMGDFQTAEEVLEDPALPAAEPNSLAEQIDFLARVTLAVGKKAPNAEALMTEATRVCTDDDASLRLKLLLAEHRMHVGENPRPLVEEVLSIARNTKRQALATEAEALLIMLNPSDEDSWIEYEKLLERSGPDQLQSTTAFRLFVTFAKSAFELEMVEEAKKLVEWGHLLLTNSAQNITNASIRARVIAAGCAKLRTALPIEGFTSVLDDEHRAPCQDNGPVNG